MECQEKNGGMALFFSYATSSSRASLQLLWDAVEQMTREVEHDAAHGIVPRMREDARAQTAAEMRKDAEEGSIQHDEQHSACAFIAMREAEKHR